MKPIVEFFVDLVLVKLLVDKRDGKIGVQEFRSTPLSVPGHSESRPTGKSDMYVPEAAENCSAQLAKSAAFAGSRMISNCCSVTHAYTFSISCAFGDGSAKRSTIP